MAQYLDRSSQEIIINDLGSEQHDIKLRGLQRLCREVENGSRPLYPAVFAELVISKFFSPFAKTRRWAYYAARLLGLQEALLPLEFHLLRETDPSCRLWAWNAFVTLADTIEIKRMLSTSSFDYFGTPLQLIPLPDGVIDDTNTPMISWDDVQEDAGAARWVPISFGYDELSLSVPGVMPMDATMIKELQKHEDISVAEYAIWSFFKRRDGSSSDLSLSLSDIANQAPGIRSWAYRLLFKDHYSEEKEEFAVDAITRELQQEDQAARLGLARAIRGYYWSGLENLVIQWHEREDDQTTRLALLEHMIRNSESCPDYPGYVSEIYRKTGEESGVNKALDDIIFRSGLQQSSRLLTSINEEKRRRRSGDIVMGNKVEIGSIGSINANVVNFGTMRDAAKQSLYQADHRHLVAPIRNDLSRFIDLVEADADLDEQTKIETAAAINELAQAEPGKVEGAASKALKAIQNTAAAAKGSAEVAEAAQRIAEVLQNVI